MQDLNAELEAITQRKAELEAALVAATEAAKTGLASEIYDRIIAEGHDPDAVIAILSGMAKPKRNGKAAKPSTTAATGWSLRADPSRTYTRGPTPKWMKAAMAEAGMADDRKGFVEAFMDRHAA